MRAHGVTTLFTLCGDHTNPVLDAADGAGIRLIDTRDERGAAWMAAGWALATGEPGVVVVSNAPALQNASTALLDAQTSGHPVVCLAGGVGLEDRGRGHPGDVDQVELAHPLAQWAARATSADTAGALTAEAFRQARGGRPGVAVIDLPMDVQHARGDGTAVEPQPIPRIEPDPDLLSRATRALAIAERPVIIAGGGCWWSGAGEALQTFVERARIPVFTARAARGLISDDHELCFGFPNLLTRAAQLAYAEADVAVVVGTKLDVMLGGGAFAPSCTLIRVDIDPSAFAVGREAQVGIVADTRATLEALARDAEARPTKTWIGRLREAAHARAERIAARKDISSSPLHPGRLVAEIAAALPHDAIVCADAGELALWAIDAIPARAPASFHASSASALGALGMGVPWAIGMKLARPDRPVLALCGDGSFGFTALEVETAARHGAPIAVVVGNDGGWGIVRHLQHALHGRPIASDLPRSPYELLGEFAGGVGDRVETPQQAAIAITNALAAAMPSVVNAIIDPRVEHEAIPLIASMFEAKRG